MRVLFRSLIRSGPVPWSPQPGFAPLMDDVHTIQPYIHSDDAEKQARLLMERFRWPDGKPCCPVCGSKRPIYRQVRRGVEGYYRCQTPLRWGKYHSKPIVFSIDRKRT